MRRSHAEKAFLKRCHEAGIWVRREREPREGLGRSPPGMETRVGTCLACWRWGQRASRTAGSQWKGA